MNAIILMPHRLLTIEEAATELGVPKGSLTTAARTHGLLVKIGRAMRLDPNDIPELIKLCQDKPKEPVSTNAATAAATTSSAIPEVEKSQQALEIAEKLKRHSPGTSPRNTDQVDPLHRIK